MIYLGQPYSHKEFEIRERRFRMAVKATAALLNYGHVVYSPILHCHPLAQLEKLPTSFAFWKNLNLGMLSKADELYVLTIDGWRESLGLTSEIAFAKENNIPINYVSDQLGK